MSQLNLHTPIPSNLSSVQPTAASRLQQSQQMAHLPATSSSMTLSMSQQADQQMQNSYQQVFNNHAPISTSVSVQNLSMPQDQNMNGFQHSMSLDETMQNYNLKKLPENLKQILERLVL